MSLPRDFKNKTEYAEIGDVEVEDEEAEGEEAEDEEAEDEEAEDEEAEDEEAEDEEAENEEAEDEKSEDEESEDEESENEEARNVVIEDEDSVVADDSSYSASGVKRNLHGVVYQCYLLMLFALKGLEKYPDFSLATEMDKAGKLDDVVLKYQTSAKAKSSTWQFLQAKHKQNVAKNKITVNNLMAYKNSDFTLIKYFISFCEIKNTFEKVGSLTICTNADYESANSTKDSGLKEFVKNIFTTPFQDGSHILYFENLCGECAKLEFNIVDDNNEALKEFIVELFRVPLLKNAKKADILENFKSVKNNLQQEYDIIILKGKKIQTKQFLEVLKSEGKKENIINTTKKLLKLWETSKDLTNSLKAAVDTMDGLRGKELNEAKIKVKKEAEKLGAQIEGRIETSVPADKEDKIRLKSIKRKLKKLKRDCLSSEEKEVLKEYIEKKFPKEESIPDKIKKKLIGFSDKKNLEEILDQIILDIDIIQIASKSADSLQKLIKEFFERLCFVINYLNVDQLYDRLNDLVQEVLLQQELLPQELVEQCSGKLTWLDSELITSNFETEMFHWFKEETGKFLTKNEILKLLASFWQKIQSVIMKGMSMAYAEKLKFYNVSFKESLNEVEKFLEDEETEDEETENEKTGDNYGKQVLYISTISTRLSAIKIYQSFEKKVKQDKFIFMKLKTLLHTKSQSEILKNFGLKSRNFLVLECEKNENPDLKERTTHLFNLIKEKLETKENKLILIAESENDFVAKFFRKFEEQARTKKEDKDIGFEHLDEVSQDYVLKAKVDFQGKILPLKNILNNDIAKIIIDGKVLTEIIERQYEGVKIKIGNTNVFNSLHYNENYYIDRTLMKNNSAASVISEDEIDFKEKIIIVANQAGTGKSALLASIAHKMKGKFPYIWFHKITLNNYGLKTMQCATNDKDLAFLSRLIIPGSNDDIIIEFQRKIFKAKLKPRIDSNIVIFFDGLDEISPECASETAKLIDYLTKESSLKQCWITTRNLEEPYLKKEWKKCAYNLQPFNVDDQSNFFNKFYKWKLKFYDRKFKVIKEPIRILNNIFKNLKNAELREEIANIIKLSRGTTLKELRLNIDTLDFSNYANELIAAWENSVSKEEKTFLESPLHLFILGTVVFENEFNDVTEMRLTDLYRKFINTKFRIYFEEKAKLKSGNQAADTVKAIAFGALRRIHQEEARKLLEIPNLTLTEMEKFATDLEELSKGKSEEKKPRAVDELERVGLLVKNSDGELEFIHRSFAEYFLADYKITNNVDESSETEVNDFELAKRFYTEFKNENMTLKSEHETSKIKGEVQECVTTKMESEPGCSGVASGVNNNLITNDFIKQEPND